MAKPAAPRVGEILTVKGRPIPFSLHPVVRTSRRFGLQSRIFATNPWGLIRQSVEDSISGVARDEAAAFIVQAEYFFRTAQESTLVLTKPLLVYYAFLNLVKALALKKGIRTSYDVAKHGLSESVPVGGAEFVDSVLTAFRSTNASANLFDDLLRSLTNRRIPKAKQVLHLKNLMPQLLQGHRIWCEAAGAGERFVEIHRIDYVHEKATKNIWLVVNIFSDDLTRFGISKERLINESGLSIAFREVVSTETLGTRRLLKFESKIPVSYTGRASDKVQDLVGTVRSQIWATALTIPPYRKYYLYLCPVGEAADLLEQLFSVYACFYYLGSVTRYRPHLFEQILKGRHGGHIQEVIANLPQQFLYLLASEFAGREVAHAPLV